MTAPARPSLSPQRARSLAFPRQAFLYEITPAITPADARKILEDAQSDPANMPSVDEECPWGTP
jgi:hypothetical protein